jgi:hypothetical protein
MTATANKLPCMIALPAPPPRLLQDHKESLMNVKQGKWARQMLENLRLSCCVAGTKESLQGHRM